MHPQRDKEFYEDATAWAVEDMYDKGYMSSEGKIVIFDTFYKAVEQSEILEWTRSDKNGEIKRNSAGNFEESIFPLHIMKLENGMMSVFLDTSSYKKELFIKRTEEGIMGSGYD